MNLSDMIACFERIKEKYGDCEIRIDIDGQHVEANHVICFFPSKREKYVLISDGRLKNDVA